MRLRSLGPRAATVLLALALTATLGALTGQAQSTGTSTTSQPCIQDRAVLDADADGVLTVGDVFLSPAAAVGAAGAEETRLNRPLPTLAGALSFFDLDADGAPSREDVAAWDRTTAGANVGDILLGNLSSDGGTLPFGTVLRPGDGVPAAALLPYPGGVLGFWDESGDGAHQPGEPLYGGRGASLVPNDVRLDAEGWPRGSLVRSIDQDNARPLTAGPAMAFLDEDGTGSFNIPACASSGTDSATSTSSATSSSSTVTSTGDCGDPLNPLYCPTSGPAVDGTSAPGGDDDGRGTPLPWPVAAGAVLVAFALVRRRLA